MIDERLLKLDYYLTKLSMSFRKSYGIQEQFALIHKILQQIDSSLDSFFESLDIIHNAYTDSSNQYEYDILDKIASIYGVARTFSVEYDAGEEELVHKDLRLTNYELLVLIRARIIQNTFKGSYEECLQFYKLINLNNNVVMINDVNNATCNLYLKPTSSTYITENIIDMFSAGLLTLQSAGIKYNHYNYDISTLGVWDNTDWDSITRLWG